MRLKRILIICLLVASPRAMPETIPFIVQEKIDCDGIIRACDALIEQKDAQAEALKRAVTDARKEADNCYKESRESASGAFSWIAPLALGIGLGLAAGVIVGR